MMRVWRLLFGEAELSFNENKSENSRIVLRLIQIEENYSNLRLKREWLMIDS